MRARFTFVSPANGDRATAAATTITEKRENKKKENLKGNVELALS